MAIVYTDSQNYQDIADALRARNGSTDQYTPSQMANAVYALTGEQGAFQIVTVQNRHADSTGNVGFPHTPETDDDLVTKGYLTQLISEQINQAKTFIINTICPVGKLFITADSTNPGEYLGGTWEQVKDKFILAAGDTYAAGSTGGEATHTLTIDEMPSHTHKSHGWAEVTDGSGNYLVFGASATSNSTKAPTQATGGSEPHNNMPPYEVFYIWKRIS